MSLSSTYTCDVINNSFPLVRSLRQRFFFFFVTLSIWMCQLLKEFLRQGYFDDDVLFFWHFILSMWLQIHSTLMSSLWERCDVFYVWSAAIFYEPQKYDELTFAHISWSTYQIQISSRLSNARNYVIHSHSNLGCMCVCVHAHDYKEIIHILSFKWCLRCFTSKTIKKTTHPNKNTNTQTHKIREREKKTCKNVE